MEVNHVADLEVVKAREHSGTGRAEGQMNRGKRVAGFPAVRRPPPRDGAESLVAQRRVPLSLHISYLQLSVF